jgi:multiple antibiotic resistance protein
MRNIIQATITILSLINPVICAAIFAGIAASLGGKDRILIASKAAAAIFAILIIAALFGAQLLKAFGISLDAFQVAGGIVLAWMGFSMLRGSISHTQAHKLAAASEESLAPLILFAASPGTITGVITIAINHSKSEIPVSALAGITIAVALTWLLMVVVVRQRKSTGGSNLTRDITTRFMGLIVLSMGVQFALVGYRNFMDVVHT